MESLKISSQLLKKTLTTLHQAFDVIKEAERTGSKSLVLAAQDSIIQRFEYSYDAFWKFLKKYLEITYSVQDIHSPRSVFRTCVKNQICTEDEGSILLDMIDDRNETSHNYDIEKVRSILPDIPKYYTVIVVILERIEQK